MTSSDEFIKIETTTHYNSNKHMGLAYGEIAMISKEPRVSPLAKFCFWVLAGLAACMLIGWLSSIPHG